MSRFACYCVLGALLLTLSCGDKPDVYNISIPNLQASSDESIVFIDVRVNAGTIQAVSNIPVGWQVRVDDDPNWTSSIKMNSTVGAASLAPDEVKRLIFSVRRNETDNFKFDVSADVSLTKAFEKRRLDLKMSDFSLNGTQ